MKKQISLLSSVALGGLLVLNSTVDVNAAPSLNPYNGLESEVNFGQSGTEVVTDKGVKAVSGIESGDYFVVKDVNFSKGVSQFKVKAKADKASVVEIREGGADGDVIANIKLNSTNGEYKEFVAKSTVNLDGKKSIAFVGKMGSCAIDNWTAVEASEDSAANASTEEKKTDNKTEEAKETSTDSSSEKTGPGPMIDPYESVPTAFVSTDSKGVEQEEYNGTKVVTSLEEGDSYVVHNVKFDKGVATLNISAKSDKAAAIEIRDGSVDGKVLGNVKINNTEGEYKSYIAKMENIEGTHALVFVGKMGSVSIEKWNAMCPPNYKPGKEDTKEEEKTENKDDVKESEKTADTTEKTGSGATLYPYNDVSTGVNYGETKGIEYVDYNGKKVVSNLGSGDYFTVKDVDFKKGAAVLMVSAKADKPAIVEVKDGGADGELLGTIKIGSTDGKYKSYSVQVDITGKHTIAFVGKFGDASIESWKAMSAPSDKKVENDTDKDKTQNDTAKDNEKTDDTNDKTAPGPDVNPYESVSTGLKFGESKGTELVDYNGSKVISSLESGDYFVVNNVDFTKGVAIFNLSVKSDKVGTVEIRDGGVDGEVIATALVKSTGGEYKSLIVKASKSIEGKHAIAFVGKGGNVSIEKWSAMSAPQKKDNADTQTPEKPSDNGNTGSTQTPEKPSDNGNTGSTQTPEKPVDNGNTGSTQTPAPSASSEKLTLTHTLNDWGSGYLVDFRVSNNSGETVNGWKLKIKKDGIKINQSWCMEIKEDGDYYVITPLFWNSLINNGNFIQFGIIGQGTAPRTITYEFVK